MIYIGKKRALKQSMSTEVQCLNTNCAHYMEGDCALKSTLLSKKGRCMNIIDKKHAESYKEANEK